MHANPRPEVNEMMKKYDIFNCQESAEDARSGER